MYVIILYLTTSELFSAYVTRVYTEVNFSNSVEVVIFLSAKFRGSPRNNYTEFRKNYRYYSILKLIQKKLQFSGTYLYIIMYMNMNM